MQTLFLARNSSFDMVQLGQINTLIEELIWYFLQYLVIIFIYLLQRII